MRRDLLPSVPLFVFMTIRIVFSDLDGTLVHYPKEPERF